jgi:hypothetical protein
MSEVVSSRTVVGVASGVLASLCLHVSPVYNHAIPMTPAELDHLTFLAR